MASERENLCRNFVLGGPPQDVKCGKNFSISLDLIEIDGFIRRIRSINNQFYLPDFEIAWETGGAEVGQPKSERCSQDCKSGETGGGSVGGDPSVAGLAGLGSANGAGRAPSGEGVKLGAPGGECARPPPLNRRVPMTRCRRRVADEQGSLNPAKRSQTDAVGWDLKAPMEIRTLSGDGDDKGKLVEKALQDSGMLKLSSWISISQNRVPDDLINRWGPPGRKSTFCSARLENCVTDFFSW